MNAREAECALKVMQFGMVKIILVIDVCETWSRLDVTNILLKRKNATWI